MPSRSSRSWKEGLPQIQQSVMNCQARTVLMIAHWMQTIFIPACFRLLLLQIAEAGPFLPLRSKGFACDESAVSFRCCSGTRWGSSSGPFCSSWRLLTSCWSSVVYDSDTRQALPQVPWIKKVEGYDTSYWNKQTEISQGDELAFRVNLVTLQNRYNQTGGFHSLQEMYSCEVGPENRKGGYFQFGYDGRDFLSFDKETLTWTAAQVEAQVSKRKLERDRAFTQHYKAYLEEECVEWLKRYLDYGKEVLQRTAVSQYWMTLSTPPEPAMCLQADYDLWEPYESVTSNSICHEPPCSDLSHQW
ncbi:RT1 class I histocompatibility antigen, AA alpha chain-like isoform X2 [Rhineura floridana]|uniref:RT1 class I histocompatibility antigen, AA alpha chain-like isoform X2 n=1 Tax=Rhineura floridana TaxID=261503 RepID=UPI002AC871D3|nr:RT1 class I histocompatibility antigen, AA alpha chain-like isoform X2 [Rhineura floridana]